MISELDIWRAANLLIRQHGAGRLPKRRGGPVRCSIAATMTGGRCGRGSGPAGDHYAYFQIHIGEDADRAD